MDWCNYIFTPWYIYYESCFKTPIRRVTVCAKYTIYNRGQQPAARVSVIDTGMHVNRMIYIRQVHIIDDIVWNYLFIY